MYDDHFLGEIRMFTGEYPPKGWAFCDGSPVSARRNPALFSLLYDRYGTVDRETARLPDLRSRVPIGKGAGYGLSIDYELGNAIGTETVSAVKNIPARYKAQSPHQFSSLPPNQSLIQPVFAVNFIIAIEGTFPSRAD